MSENPLFLGIDTGGTFTDGVLFDPVQRAVLHSVKTPTTHHDLKVCVLEALEQLVPGDPGRVALVGLSTTLATNAVAEGKRKPVGLALLGYDPALVRQFKFERQFGTPHFAFVDGYYDRDGHEITPLDEQGLLRLVGAFEPLVEALAVCAYHGPMNASHEAQAGRLLAERFGKPVVQAHHLSSELDSIRRAATASLNASLLSNLDEFAQAVLEALRGRGVACPVMIVRGDGSLMELGYARQRPVEMVHSGPATSAIGGGYLARLERGLVIDMGGTTTDLALVDQGAAQVRDAAATIGAYRTCVRTVRARSFGLGGDSRIAFDRWGNLEVGPERVIPFARYCALNPQHRSRVTGWLEINPRVNYSEKLEFWALRRPPRIQIEDPVMRRVIALLQDGPQPYWLVRERVGPIAPVLVQEMVDLEIIERVGLTPTDLLHTNGEFSAWDAAAAALAVQVCAATLETSPQALRQRMQDEVTRHICAEIVQFLSEREFSDPLTRLERQLDRWLFEEGLYQTDAYLGSKTALKIPIVGIGAPARIFLPPVARALETEIIFPDHYEVANAVGAVVGNVVVRQQAQVLLSIDGDVVGGYYVRLPGGQQLFKGLDEALEFARRSLRESTAAELKSAGAGSGEVLLDEQELLDGSVHLHASGVGRPG